MKRCTNLRECVISFEVIEDFFFYFKVFVKSEFPSMLNMKTKKKLKLKNFIKLALVTTFLSHKNKNFFLKFMF